MTKVLTKQSTKQLNAQSLAYFRAHPIEFIETCLYDPETSQPFVLLPAERQFLAHAFKISESGKLVYSEWLYSCPKKSGKTTFAALIIITMVLLYGGSFPEAFALANDQEQAQSRVFEFIKRIILASPLLKNEAQITQYKIMFPAFNATIQAIASDAGSAAGSNACISCFDELWAYTSERSRRLWDEMNVPPTRKIAARLTVSYAGFDGELELLQELYKRGLLQQQIGTDLYGGDGLLMFWSHVGIAPWQDEAWAAAMRRERPSAFQRQFLNEFASSSSQFISMSAWDKCVDPTATPLPSAPHLPVYIGVDAGLKRDASAIVVTYYDEAAKVVRLVYHRVFVPTPDAPLDFEQTIEATLTELSRKYYVRKIVFDPWQMQAMAQRLTRAGLPIEEFPQSSPRLSQAAQNLFDLIESQSLVLYASDDMRLAVSRCVAQESSRGWKISKDKQAHHINVVIALMMSAQACIAGQGDSNFDTNWANWIDGRDETKQTKAQAESDANFRWRLNNYFNAIGMPYHWR